MLMLPRRIYLCGGGVNVIAHLGVLEELHKHGMLCGVKEWIGVSAGALFALCVTIGFTLTEIRDFYMRFDFQNTTDPDPEFAPGWILNYGFDTGNRLQRLIEALLHEKKLSTDITFADLNTSTKKLFRTFATDLNSAGLLEFSAKATPHYKVVDAVRASMSFPYYFQPFHDPISGHLLIDGAVISNYPLHMLTDDELADCLGVYFATDLTVCPEIELKDVLLRPILMLMSSRGRREAAQYPNRTIVVHVGERNSLNFSITEEQKKELVQLGRNGAREYIHHHRRPVRRYSVA